MGTTELHAEQVIVGGIVLAAAILPWAPEVSRYLGANDGISGLVAGAGVVAAAYVVGVVSDRLADTLTEWLEGCQRLLFAEKALAAGATPPTGRDPFPEDRLRMRALALGGDVSAWIDYHRSRARIARAMAVYLPFLTWSLAVGLGRVHLWRRPTTALVLLEPVALAVMVAGAAWLQNKNKEMARTDATAECRERSLRQAGADATNPKSLSPLLRHPSTWVSGALLVAAATWAGYLEIRGPGLGGRVLAPTLACAGLSLMSWWAWWRISHSYRTYLQLLQERKAPSFE